MALSIYIQLSDRERDRTEEIMLNHDKNRQWTITGLNIILYHSDHFSQHAKQVCLSQDSHVCYLRVHLVLNNSAR